MEGILQLVGPERAVEFLGIRLVGINAVNGTKLMLSVAFVLIVLGLKHLIGAAVHRILRARGNERFRFWTRQAGALTTVVLLVLGIASIWFNDPRRLATALGLITAALAIALQRVITAIAGYFVILRGRTFAVGDRIVMGGVRGDVIALRLTQTMIMEMGQPPPVEPRADPAIWVRSRQYTGRIVSVSNSKIFEEPVFNYSSDFPYLWEEMNIAIRYDADRVRAEEILLNAAQRHTTAISDISQEALRELQRRYFLKPADIAPRAYYRLTDNWLELTVRFIVEEHGIREVKDAISREILRQFDEAGITIASQTYEIVAVPPLRAEIVRK